MMVSASAALERFKGLNDEVGIADSLHLIGCSFLRRDQEETALPRFLESLKIFRAKENTVGIVRCLERLGELYRRKGRSWQALSALEEAVDIASVCGYRLEEATALIGLGVTHLGMDDIDGAFHRLQKARDIARSIGWEHGVSGSMCRLGLIEIIRGNHSEAEELIREAVVIARRSDGGWRLAQALHELGWCYQCQGKLPDATLALEESYQKYRDVAQSPEPRFVTKMADLADALAAEGETDQALTWYERAIVASGLRKEEDLWFISTCLSKKGEILLAVGRYEEGALHFEASMAVDRERGDDRGVKRNRNKLSSIPKTPIKWEVRRHARLALNKVQTPRTTSLLCDVKKLQRRVPQLTTPHLKSPVKIVKRSDS